MTRSATAALAALACALLASCAAHTVTGPTRPAGTSTTVSAARYLVCQNLGGPGTNLTPRHEPAVLYMSGDGSLWAKDITWTGWGTTTATGQGTAEDNACRPDCAQGTFSPYPVTITLTRPVARHLDMVYTRAAVSIPSLGLHNTYAFGPVPVPPAMRAAGAASAALTGSCSAGYEPAHATANGAVAYGPFTPGQPSGDVSIGGTRYAPAAAYEATITNTGSTTTEVTGFGVVFNSVSALDQRTVAATYIPARHAVRWLEVSPDDTLGSRLSGPATGHRDSSIPSGGFATCQVVEWTSP
jgi:hypothetical protein